ELVRLAKPGGLVLIHTDMETPERDGQGFRNWWYAAPPDHCCFYRHKTFQVYLEDKPHRLVWKSPKSVIIKKNGSLVT
ncbi:MAG: methyltransferase domain-containing protein, partial [Balneolales bacterium]